MDFYRAKREARQSVPEDRHEFNKRGLQRFMDERNARLAKLQKLNRKRGRRR